MKKRAVAFEVVQQHALGAFGDLTSEAMNLLDKAVAALRVDSTFGPPIYIPDPFRDEAAQAAAGGPAPTTIQGKGFDATRLLKPKFTFEMRQGWGANRAWAPYGDPGENHWGIVLGVGLIVFLLAGYGTKQLVTRR